MWYEAVGGPYQTNGEIPIQINGAYVQPSCGIPIYTEVWFAPNDPTVNVGDLIINENTGVEYWYGYAPQHFQSGQLSAEWIDERPCCQPCGDFFQLADYNYSQWRDAYASPNNPTAPYYPIGYFTHTRSWMEDEDGNRIAWTDVLGSNNDGGTDNYKTYFEGNGVVC